MQKPLVSVVIPMYNASAFILETLSSVYAQNYPHLEVIVVDDGSTDNSKDLVFTYYPEFKYIFESASGGPAKARNDGVKNAQGNFISFFDADDIMCPWKISMQTEFLQQNDDVGAVYMDYQNFGYNNVFLSSHFATCPNLQKKLKYSQKGKMILYPLEARKILVEENFIISDSIFLRKEVFENIGGFDLSLKGSEDFEFCYRLSSRFPVGIINEIGFRRRLHGENISYNGGKILKYKIKSRLRILNYEEDKALRRDIRKRISEYYIALGYHYIEKNKKLAFCNTVKSTKYRHLFMKNMARNIVKSVFLKREQRRNP